MTLRPETLARLDALFARPKAPTIEDPELIALADECEPAEIREYMQILLARYRVRDLQAGRQPTEASQ